MPANPTSLQPLPRNGAARRAPDAKLRGTDCDYEAAEDFARQIAAFTEVARSHPGLAKVCAVSIAEVDYTGEIASKVSGFPAHRITEAGRRLAHAVILHGEQGALAQAISQALRDLSPSHAVLIAYEAAVAGSDRRVA